jgi:hypothetical protein
MDQPATNVLQIVALNTICVILTVTTLKLFGFSWSTAIFLGWLGAMPFTLAIAFGFICLMEWRRGDAAQDETSEDQVEKIGAPLSEGSRAAHFQMWQEDVLEDDWAALAERRQRSAAQDTAGSCSEATVEQKRYSGR